MLVVDASVAVAAVLSPVGFEPVGDRDLVAPALMWSEARSALRGLVWRGDIHATEGEAARVALEDAAVTRRDARGLGRRAWEVADELGWARTYDAEYVALALLLGCRLVTLDERLRRGADRLGCVVTPAEL